MKLSSKYRYLIAGILVIFFSAIIVTALIPGTRHTSDIVDVTIGTQIISLQAAINAGSLSEADGTFCTGRTCGVTPCGGSCAPTGSCPTGICYNYNCCTPEAYATTCSGKCGAQTNNCGEDVDCVACSTTCTYWQEGRPDGGGWGSGSSYDTPGSAGACKTLCENAKVVGPCYYGSLYTPGGCHSFTSYGDSTPPEAGAALYKCS